MSAIDYWKCPGCGHFVPDEIRYKTECSGCKELATEKARIVTLERTLRVVRTWASCHVKGMETLDAEQVVKIIDEALEGTP